MIIYSSSDMSSLSSSPEDEGMATSIGGNPNDDSTVIISNNDDDNNNSSSSSFSENIQQSGSGSSAPGSRPPLYSRPPSKRRVGNLNNAAPTTLVHEKNNSDNVDTLPQEPTKRGPPTHSLQQQEQQPSHTTNNNDKQSLCWRMDPIESLSDWTISIVHSTTGDTRHYHVHRVVLAVGQRTCAYFRELFRHNNNNEDSNNKENDTINTHNTTKNGSFEALLSSKRTTDPKGNHNKTDEEKEEEEEPGVIKTNYLRKTSTTCIEFLHAEACDLFPLFLDYLYGKDIGNYNIHNDDNADTDSCSDSSVESNGNNKRCISTETAVGLYYLARFFRQPQLQEDVRTFIRQDLRFDTVEKYYCDVNYYYDFDTSDDESNVHNQEEENDFFEQLLTLVAQTCARDIRKIEPTSSLLYEMSPDFMETVLLLATTTMTTERPFRLVPLLCSNQYYHHLSILVAEYCILHPSQVTADDFQQLTTPERLPVVDVTAALKLLLLEQDILQLTHVDESSSGEDEANKSAKALSSSASAVDDPLKSEAIIKTGGAKTNLQQRCILSLTNGWVQLNRLHRESTAETLQKLPHTLAVELMQAIMMRADQQMSVLDQKVHATLHREEQWKASYDQVGYECNQAHEQIQSLEERLQTTKSEFKGQLQGLMKRDEHYEIEKHIWQKRQEEWVKERHEFQEAQEEWKEERQDLKADLKEAKKEMRYWKAKHKSRNYISSAPSPAEQAFRFVDSALASFDSVSTYS